MTKGSKLCCTGLKPGEGKYCVKCGEKAETEACCKEGAEKCGECGKNKGAPLCCVDLKSDDDKGHDHEGHDHDGDKDAS